MEKNRKMEDDEGSLRLSVAVRLYFLVEDGSRKTMNATWKFDKHRWPCRRDTVVGDARRRDTLVGDEEDEDSDAWRLGHRKKILGSWEESEDRRVEELLS